MSHIPSSEAILEKVAEIFQTCQPTKAIAVDRPLILELGFDSLDLIEASFSLEETFGFEFSDRNPIEELDKALGGGRLIQLGKFTQEGREQILKRMPELAHLDLPEDLTLHQLQSYFTIQTFARIIHEFYESIPNTCPETNEAAILEGWAVLREGDRQPIKAASGNQLIDQWVQSQQEEMV